MIGRRLLRRTLPVCAVLLGAAAAAGPARADDSTTDATLAESLFEQARALMAQGRYADACPKLAESQRLDPGGGTLVNLAVCHENEGKTASAWAEFEEALAEAKREGRDDRERLSSNHLQVLEPRLSRLQIVVPASSRVKGLTVSLDGVVVEDPAWGVVVPQDPGAHVVAARAPGFEDWKREVRLDTPGQLVAVEIPPLHPSEVAAAPAATAVIPPPPGSIVPAARPRAGAQRTVAYALGATGIIGVGLGTAAAILASAAYASSRRNCSSPTDCSNHGQAVIDRDTASSWAAASTVAFIAGAGLLAGGALLFFAVPTAPSSGAAGLAVRGAF